MGTNPSAVSAAETESGGNRMGGTAHSLTLGFGTNALNPNPRQPGPLSPYSTWQKVQFTLNQYKSAKVHRRWSIQLAGRNYIASK